MLCGPQDSRSATRVPLSPGPGMPDDAGPALPVSVPSHGSRRSRSLFRCYARRLFSRLYSRRNAALKISRTSSAVRGGLPLSNRSRTASRAAADAAAPAASTATDCRGAAPGGASGSGRLPVPGTGTTRGTPSGRISCAGRPSGWTGPGGPTRSTSARPGRSAPPARWIRPARALAPASRGPPAAAGEPRSRRRVAGGSGTGSETTRQFPAVRVGKDARRAGPASPAQARPDRRAVPPSAPKGRMDRARKGERAAPPGSPHCPGSTGSPARRKDGPAPAIERT